jgi:hypothetical protein
MLVQMVDTLLTDAGEPAARYVRSRPLRMSKGRPEDLRRCRKHFERCLRHPKCMNAAEKAGHLIGPKRLLDVQHNSLERLYTVPKGNHPPYVALSYCWGRTQPDRVKTTTTNVHDRHDVTDLSVFPQTIQDAVEVCRSFGFHYIWIDALCIVQDDIEDKASEIAKMGSIYQGAALTIAAASAANSTDGFLQDRTFEEAYGHLFRLPYCHKQDGDITRGSILLSGLPISDKYQERIDERGWTLQEDMLSLRLLRFGSKQTTWRCPTHPDGVKIDGGSDPVRENEDMAFAVDNPSRNAGVRSKVIEAGASASSNVYGSWQKNIERYTLRTLTRASDKLSACAALAGNFSDIMRLPASDYLAGLWKPDLPAQLLWYRLEVPDLPAHLLGYWPEVTNPARCSGPTWSWASLDRPITYFLRVLTQYDLTVKARAHYVDSQINHRFKECQYAEVESGRLDLQGRLQKARWNIFGLRGHTTSLEILPVTITWDIVENAPPETVWCFEIVGSYLTLGLALVAKGQMAFERVGYFKCSPGKDHELVQDWFNKVEPQTISIY